jgi:hypothetical protein
MEGDNLQNFLVWSVNEAESDETMKQLRYAPAGGGWPYFGAIWWAIQRLPFITIFAWDTLLPTTQKVVTDMVARLDLLMTRDDGQTYPVALIITGVNNNIRVEIPDLATGATNLSGLVSVKAAIKLMLDKIMDPAQVIVA